MNNETKYIVDVMTHHPVVVGPNARTWHAERLAEEKGVHDLLVLDAYHLVGVVCLCDLYDADPYETVADRMRQPVTIEDQETAEAAADMMERCAVGCLPVVDWSGEMRGVVTRRDLFKAAVIAEEDMRVCEGCGSTHGLSHGDGLVPFCLRCLDHARPPMGSIEELYFTVGGGD